MGYKYNNENKSQIDESLSAAIASLEAAKSKAGEIVIPSDFKCAKELEDILSGINEVSLGAISIGIQVAENNFESTELSAKNAANALVFEIKTKSESIFEKKEGSTKNVVNGVMYNIKERAENTFLPVCLMKVELNKYANEQVHLNDEEKKVIKEQIKLINTTTIKNSNTDIETYKKNFMNAINLVNEYEKNQHDTIQEGYSVDNEVEEKIRLDNIQEYMQDIVNASTHVKDDGYLYTYKDGKEERLTVEEWLKIVKQTADEIYENSSKQGGTNYYGNSGTPEAGQYQYLRTDGNQGYIEVYEVDHASLVSCNRLISMALNNAGLYDDQTLGGDNVCQEEYLTGHGFDKVEDLTDIRSGDIIVINAGSFMHYFVVNEYNEETELCTKFDMGSDKRINTVQPNEEVPIVEEGWAANGRVLDSIYRLKE